MKKIVLILVLASFLFAASFAVLNNASETKAFKLMANRQPERITELYFTNYPDIPHRLKVGHLYQVNFTITNRQYHDKSYFYKATIAEDNIKNVVAEKKVHISDNQSSEQQIQFMPTKPNALIKITIELINSGHEIRFKAKTWSKKTKKQKKQQKK